MPLKKLRDETDAEEVDMAEPVKDFDGNLSCPLVPQSSRNSLEPANVDCDEDEGDGNRE